MEIPLYVNGYKSTNYRHNYVTCNNIRLFDISGIPSIYRCLEDNKNIFTQEEYIFLKELINSEDLDNLKIAISIINAK